MSALNIEMINFQRKVNFPSIFIEEKQQCPTMSGKISMLLPSFVYQESTFMIFHANSCENITYEHFNEIFI